MPTAEFLLQCKRWRDQWDADVDALYRYGLTADQAAKMPTAVLMGMDAKRINKEALAVQRAMPPSSRIRLRHSRRR